MKFEVNDHGALVIIVVVFVVYKVVLKLIDRDRPAVPTDDMPVPDA